VQAADPVGQLGDPLYARKANALYYEFEEIGMNRQIEYTSRADLIDKYPTFYWNNVAGHLGAATAYCSGSDYLNRISASIGGGSAGVKLPSGRAAG